MNEQTKQVIEYCSEDRRLVFLCDDFLDYNTRGIISAAQNMTDDFIEWDNNEVDWNKVEDVLYWLIQEKIQYSEPFHKYKLR